MNTTALAFAGLIFVAEVAVVTVATLRIIFVARGHKFIAPILGLFEITLWLVAVGITMKRLDEWQCCVAFVSGFTLGSYLGILIEKRLALGTAIVRIITHKDAAELVERLRAANFGVTCVEATGATGKVQIVMTVVKRKQLASIIAMIEAHHPGAFFAVDEVQSATEGIFPVPKERPTILPTPVAKIWRFIDRTKSDQSGSARR